MLNFAEQIADALDILKFDGAVQDTLAELRGKWGAQVPALLDERFDAVGVQYMKLSHEKGAAALGQKLHRFIDRIGRRPPDVRHDRQLLPGHRIDQTRFSRISPSKKRDMYPLAERRLIHSHFDPPDLVKT